MWLNMIPTFFGTYSTTSYKIIEAVNYDETYDNFICIEIGKDSEVYVNRQEYWSDFIRKEQGSYLINIMYVENDGIRFINGDDSVIVEVGKNIINHDEDYFLSRKKPYLKMTIDKKNNSVTLFSNKKESYFLSQDNIDEFSTKPMTTMFTNNKVNQEEVINIIPLLSDYRKSLADNN